jgi:hypothetical protein
MMRDVAIIIQNGSIDTMKMHSINMEISHSVE